MHASTSDTPLAGPASAHPNKGCETELCHDQLHAIRQAELALGARRLFVSLRCFFCTLWILFAGRAVYKLISLPNWSSTPYFSPYVLMLQPLRECFAEIVHSLARRLSSVSLPAQLVCAAIATIGGLYVEIWGVRQALELPSSAARCATSTQAAWAQLHPFDTRSRLHPACLLSYQYLAFAGAAVYTLVDASVFVMPVHISLAVIAMCCVFDTVRFFGVHPSLLPDTDSTTHHSCRSPCLSTMSFRTSLRASLPHGCFGARRPHAICGTLHGRWACFQLWASCFQSRALHSLLAWSSPGCGAPPRPCCTCCGSSGGLAGFSFTIFPLFFVASLRRASVPIAACCIRS